MQEDDFVVEKYDMIDSSLSDTSLPIHFNLLPSRYEAFMNYFCPSPKVLHENALEERDDILDTLSFPREPFEHKRPNQVNTIQNILKKQTNDSCKG